MPNEDVKARAVIERMNSFAADRLIDGVSYGDIDECNLYTTGLLVGACLFDSIGTKLLAYIALATSTRQDF